ncbi:Uncharacterised protein [Streptococcus agalactiae]|nr:Uncharacterised protein [Streptococcus agalactiae]
MIGKFFQGFQLVGTTLFILILVTSAIAGVFTKPVKYKGVITNFLLVTMVTAVLPLALTTISSVVAQDAMNIQTVSSEAPEGSRYYSSLAIQPMKNNVVDLKVLIDNDFSTELFPLDNFGYIKPPKKVQHLSIILRIAPINEIPLILRHGLILGQPMALLTPIF